MTYDDDNVYDLQPAEPPDRRVPWRMRRAQVVQTMTETQGDPYAYQRERRFAEYASPEFRTFAANIVAVGAAVLLVTLDVAAASVVVTLLVRALEWLA